jgi:hypothetical protein
MSGHRDSLTVAQDICAQAIAGTLSVLNRNVREARNGAVVQRVYSWMKPPCRHVGEFEVDGAGEVVGIAEGGWRCRY